MSLIAIQLAVLSGFQVITTSSPAHFDYLKSLGATTVIDRSAADAAAQILAAAGGPVKYVVDPISLPPTQLLGVEILQSQGSLVLVTATQPPTQAAADAKGITVLAFYGRTGWTLQYVLVHMRARSLMNVQGNRFGTQLKACWSAEFSSSTGLRFFPAD